MGSWVGACEFEINCCLTCHLSECMKVISCPQVFVSSDIRYVVSDSMSNNVIITIHCLASHEELSPVSYQNNSMCHQNKY